MSTFALLKDFKNRTLAVEGSSAVFKDSVATAVLFQGIHGSRALKTLILKSPQHVNLSAGPNKATQLLETATFHAFYNVDGGVALRNTTTGAFLMSSNEGELCEARGPLRRDRKMKLFRLVEVAVPARTVQSFPIPVCLLDGQQDVYASASLTSRRVIGSAEAPCCSEEFVLELHSGVLEKAGSGSGAEAACSLWTSDGKSMVSKGPLDSQLLIQPQHSCMGTENFVASILPNNELTLSTASEEAVEFSWPTVLCSPNRKPTKLHMEIVKGRRTLLITAHGHLLQPSVKSDFITPEGIHYTTELNSKLGDWSWQFEHHGEDIYSLKHAESQMYLYVDIDGVLRLDENKTIVYPDKRMLFSMKMTWIALEATAENELPAGFVSLGAGECITGFTLETQIRVHGKQMLLSVLPDGRITTIYATQKPTRWELFSLCDLAVCLSSSASVLQCLEQPIQPSSDKPLPSMRRCNSMQALPAPSLPRVATQPSLPNIPEASEHLAGLPKLTRPSASLKDRRCVSESALSDLTGCPWLVQLRTPPKRPAGWGIRSAATLQELAVRQICLGLVDQVDNMDGNRCHTLEAAKQLAKELHLPDSILTNVEADLALLLSPASHTKISYMQMVKQRETLAPWGQQILAEHGDSENLPEEILEAFACTECCGESGLVLPLDPEVNPQHHRFLEAMSRRAFGRVRTQRRGRRTDAIQSAFRLAKHGILFLGVVKCLVQVLAAKNR